MDLNKKTFYYINIPFDSRFYCQNTTINICFKKIGYKEIYRNFNKCFSKVFVT